jgi:hypoxanthine phosphoribosyltransferase
MLVTRLSDRQDNVLPMRRNIPTHPSTFAREHDCSKLCPFKNNNQHVYPPEYEGHFASLVLEADEIRARVRALAAAVHEDYRGCRPVLLCTLKGACPFYTHLSDALQDLRQGYDMEFIRASSYDGTSSTGNVVFGECKVESIQNRHLIIIEDIVDTGTTLASMVPMIQQMATPASVEVCTLLDKRLDPSKKKFSAKYCGFSIPDHFIIG